MAVTYKCLASTTASGSANTVSFSGIPGTYRDLAVHAMIKTTSTSAGNYRDVGLRLNNNSNTGSHQWGGGNIQSGSLSANESGTSVSSLTNRFVLQIANNESNAGWTNLWVYIFDYTNTSFNKTVRYDWGSCYTNQTWSYVGFYNGIYNSTSAITAMDFIVAFAGDNFRADSIFSLYGIAYV